jgi:hypothetical protein
MFLALVIYAASASTIVLLITLPNKKNALDFTRNVHFACGVFTDAP